GSPEIAATRTAPRRRLRSPAAAKKTPSRAMSRIYRPARSGRKSVVGNGEALAAALEGAPGLSDRETVTLLVLLATAAGAGIVPPHLRARLDRSLGRRLLRAALPIAVGLVVLARPSLHLPLQPRRLLGLRPTLHPHQLAHQLVVDRPQHLDEPVVPFLLVGLLGILLPVGPEPDALAEVVHRQQVVLPQLV